MCPFLIGKVITLLERGIKKWKIIRVKCPFLIGKVITENGLMNSRLSINFKLEECPFLIGKVITVLHCINGNCQRR